MLVVGEEMERNETSRIQLGAAGVMSAALQANNSGREVATGSQLHLQFDAPDLRSQSCRRLQMSSCCHSSPIFIRPPSSALPANFIECNLMQPSRQRHRPRTASCRMRRRASHTPHARLLRPAISKRPPDLQSRPCHYLVTLPLWGLLVL